MKKYVFGLFILGFVSLAFSQDFTAKPGDNDAKPDNFTKTMPNAEYLKIMERQDIPNLARSLEKIVASFDIKELEIYDSKDPSEYEVVFTDGNNTVIVSFDSYGSIIRSMGKFYDVRIPTKSSVTISKKYPGWKFRNTLCLIKYSKKKAVEIMYEVHLVNNKEKKIVKTDALGNIL